MASTAALSWRWITLESDWDDIDWFIVSVNGKDCDVEVVVSGTDCCPVYNEAASWSFVIENKITNQTHVDKMLTERPLGKML